jgi:biopolymer transport protein ExbD
VGRASIRAFERGEGDAGRRLHLLIGEGEHLAGRETREPQSARVRRHAEQNELRAERLGSAQQSRSGAVLLAMGAGGEEPDELIEGINVTPLVDVTLVLLVTFMLVAAIVDTRALPLDLPATSEATAAELVLQVELRPDGLFVDGAPLADDRAFFRCAREARRRSPKARAVVRAERTVSHGRVVRVLDLLRQAGIARVALGRRDSAEAEASATSSNLVEVREAGSGMADVAQIIQDTRSSLRASRRRRTSVDLCGGTRSGRDSCRRERP